MNVSVSHSSPEFRVPSARPRMAEATLIPLGEALSILIFDMARGRRLTAERGGKAIAKPFLTAALDLQGGGVRHILVMPMPPLEAVAHRIVLRLDGVAAAEIDPAWLQLPQSDLPGLLDQLTEPAIHRLIRLLVTTGASLFSASMENRSAGDGMATAARSLMALCGIAACNPLALTEFAGRTILTYRLDRPVSRPPAEAMVLTAGRIIRRPGVSFAVEGPLLHVAMPAVREAEILAFAGRPLRLAPPGAGSRRWPIARWLEGRGGQVHDWLLGWAGEATCAALSRELLPGVRQASLTVRHLSTTAREVVLALTLHDPDRILRGVVLERDGVRAEIALRHGLTGDAPVLATLALPGRVGDNCRILAAHHSGRLRSLASLPAPAYDGTVPDGFAEGWDRDGAGLADLARLRLRFYRPAPPVVVHRFGPKIGSAAAVLRLVSPLSDVADLCRARAALILAERHARPVEVICTLADGLLASAARRLMKETAEIYGIAHRLVLLPADATEGERLRAALVDAADAPVLVLGTDVLPMQPGWLAHWVRKLGRQEVLGASLIAHDGSISATGAGDEPLRGLPASVLPSVLRRPRRPLPDGLGLAPRAIARLLAAFPHPDPALWIAGALGAGVAVETRFPFQRFGPARLPDAFARALGDAGYALLAEGAE